MTVSGGAPLELIDGMFKIAEAFVGHGFFAITQLPEVYRFFSRNQ